MHHYLTAPPEQHCTAPCPSPSPITGSAAPPAGPGKWSRAQHQLPLRAPPTPWSPTPRQPTYAPLPTFLSSHCIVIPPRGRRSAEGHLGVIQWQGPPRRHVCRGAVWTAGAAPSTGRKSPGNEAESASLSRQDLGAPLARPPGSSPQRQLCGQWGHNPPTQRGLLPH